MTAKRIAAYVAAVALWGASTYVVATAAVNSAVEEVATVSYYNAMDSCIRGNRTVRQPLSEFFAVLEARTKDPEVAQEARRIRDTVGLVEYSQVVSKVGPAANYLPPWER